MSPWFIWLGLFALLQRRLCRRYPGIRSACRYTFLATLAVAIVPALWILAGAKLGTPNLVVSLNHYFGVGVYAQTSLRALIELRWLALSPLSFGSALSLAGEGKLLRKMGSLSRALSRSNDRRQLP